jgi:hypothetical protein
VKFRIWSIHLLWKFLLRMTKTIQQANSFLNTPEKKREQIIEAVYSSIKIERPGVEKEDIEKIYDELKRGKK